MPDTPEQQARRDMDRQLMAAGWLVQEYQAADFAAGRGIALREITLTTGPCDSLLLVDRQTFGVIEAKKQGTTLSTFAEQSSRYNPAVPIEKFDSIVTDECHNSIDNLWRQVLEYFDASLIGLTATPAPQTIAYFHQNRVAEYNHERAVADVLGRGDRL